MRLYTPCPLFCGIPPSPCRLLHSNGNPSHRLRICWQLFAFVEQHIAKKSAKGQLTSSATQAQAQPAKALGCCTLLKEGHSATQAWVCYAMLQFTYYISYGPTYNIFVITIFYNFLSSRIHTDSTHVCRSTWVWPYLDIQYTSYKQW